MKRFAWTKYDPSTQPQEFAASHFNPLLEPYESAWVKMISVVSKKGSPIGVIYFKEGAKK